MDDMWKFLNALVTHPESDRIVSGFQKLCGVRGTQRNPFFDAYFRLASACGDELFSLIPLLFWLAPEISSVYITNFGFILTAGQVVKDLLKLPRPHGKNSKYEIAKLEAHYGTEYGMPSTHTMAGFLPLTVLLRLQQRGYAVPLWGWAACGGCVFSVALSRLYMGVHSVLDLISGAILAAVCAAAINQAGDSFDVFLYQSPESHLTWVILMAIFVIKYPSTKPWSASTSTACQIFGLLAGLGTATWFAHFHWVQCWQIFMRNSIASTAALDWLVVSARVVCGYAIVLFVKIASKAVLTPIFVSTFEKYRKRGYNPELMRDSDHNSIPVEKLYPVEIPVRLISYGLTAWAAILAVPIVWVWSGLA